MLLNEVGKPQNAKQNKHSTKFWKILNFVLQFCFKKIKFVDIKSSP